MDDLKPRQAAIKPTSARTDEFPLRMEGVSKVFGRTQVLFDVDFRVRKGSIRALIGANGAGKSTLMKIAQGVVKPTAGMVTIGGNRLSFLSPGEGRDAGLAMVFQELSLIPTLSVMDNIFLNAEVTSRGMLIDTKSQRLETEALFERLGVDVDPNAEVGRLGVVEQQMIEIAKALHLAKVALVLDEPTAALTEREVDRLFQIIRQAAGLGLGIVFITHRLDEIFKVCDEVTVLRDGKVTMSCDIGDTDLPTVVRRMVGAEFAISIPGEAERETPVVEQPVLKVNHLSVTGKLTVISFEVFPGEIMGIAGLAGSGRTELLKALFGVLPISCGSVEYEGSLINPRSPADAIQKGIFLIPENRRAEGLVLGHSVEENIVLPLLKRLKRFFLYQAKRGREIAGRYVRLLDVKVNSLDQLVDFLSGGNQQKVVLAKALSSESRLLLLDEPTFGIDIKTAEDIRKRIRAYADEGNVVLWVTSVLKELIDVSDRILVLADGRLKWIIPNKPTPVSEEELTHAIQPEIDKKRFDVESAFHKVARRLVREHNETVQLAILEGTDILYIGKEDCSQPVRLVSKFGTRLPAHTTGLGKALLSCLSEEELHSLYPDGHLTQMTPNSCTSLASLLEDLQKVRERGWAHDNEETAIGLQCVGSPIYDEGGHPIAALSIAAPSQRMSAERLVQLGEAVKGAASEISSLVGHHSGAQVG